MRTQYQSLSLVSLAALTLISFQLGCSAESGDTFRPPSDTLHFQTRFEFDSSQLTAKQAQYDQNRISTNFRVLKDGESVKGLQAEDFVVRENGTLIEPFSFAAETERINQVADIIFVVDITGTMVEFIESAKIRLREFINSSRREGYHTRMCISTFGNYTVKKCDRFFENNPNDPSTEAQVRELLSELAQLRAYRGEGRDPGWPDLNENSMGALVDASQAPWGEGHQRFVILVTDWGFHYSPLLRDNDGNPLPDFEGRPQFEILPVRTPPGALPDGQETLPAPSMKDITEAIESSQMTVFAVTRTEHTHRGTHYIWDGFNSPLDGYPSIVESSGGEWFDFDEVIRGRISLDNVLQRILDRMNTTYKISYVVEEVPGLSPRLSLEQRRIQITTQDPSVGKVTQVSTSSSMPQGRPEYKRLWDLGTEAIRADSLEVFINDEKVPASEYSVKNQRQVEFRQVPAPSSELRFVYLYAQPERNLRLEPLSFVGPLGPHNTQVKLNGQLTQFQHLIFASDLEGHSSLSLSPEALALEGDPYDIWAHKGLHMEVEVEF